MEISAKITGIKYQVILVKELEKIEFNEFDINECPASCLIADKKNIYAISKWVSPKRTRSYPFERVYNTLSFSKKITVIPVIKDEGIDGDRDFVQWDTISLMSLLDVYVILGYYNHAEKHRINKNKITNQKFDNQYIIKKIKEIKNYHSSALHWNLNEIKSLPDLIEKTKKSYLKIEKELNVKLHNNKNLDNIKNKIENDVNAFMAISRKKSQEAQTREIITIQPKEALHTLTKAKITISNYLGGKYFLTVDEVNIQRKTVSLIESKHSKSSYLPALSDIKDGLIKMILFANLKDVKVANQEFKIQPVLQLTSSLIKSKITSICSKKDLEQFFALNQLSAINQHLIIDLFEEANNNNFIVIINES